MKWLQQKWYDVSIRTKSILLMGMMLAVTWILVALVMIQLHTFSERSSVIMDEYMDITGFMDAFSAENASLEANMRPIQPIDAKEDYLAAIQMTNRCLEELCPDLQADRREEYALKRAIRNAMTYYRESQRILLDAEKPSEMIEHYLLLKTQSSYIDGYTRDLLHSQMVQGGMQWQEIDRINARSSKQFVAFLIVATVLMGLTLVVFKRSILAPLAALGQAADTISAGQYEAPPVVVRGDDELGRTAKSFNLMQAEIRHTIWALEKQSEMEKHLLEKEVETAQMQKKLQETRYGDRITMEVHADPALSDVPVPKFILQPLVENAIIHGLKECGGLVRVRTFRGRRGITIMVTDNGCGFCPQQSGGTTAHHSVGLDNIRERMELSGGKMDVFSRPGLGTCVRLIVGEELHVQGAGG